MPLSASIIQKGVRAKYYRCFSACFYKLFAMDGKYLCDDCSHMHDVPQQLGARIKRCLTLGGDLVLATDDCSILEDGGSTGVAVLCKVGRPALGMSG